MLYGKVMSSAELLATSVVRYEHPQSIGAITLIGTVHLASREYYATIQTTIYEMESNGTTVHTEGVRKPTQAEVNASSPEVLRKYRTFAKWLAAIDRDVSYAYPGLVPQSKNLKTRASWQTHDATSLQVAERMPEHEYQRMRSELEQSDLTSSFTRDVEEALAIANRGNIQDPDHDIRQLIAKLRESYDDFPNWMSTFREGIALDAVDRHRREQPDTDLVVIWGDGHTRSYNNALYERGYKVANAYEVIAISLTHLAPGV